MPAYSTPGVYVTEGALSSLTPSTDGVSSAAFFGEAERGPTEATLISDWNSYKVLYGDLDNAYDLGYAVYHFFVNGGRACYVNRVVNSSSVVASKMSFPFYPTGSGSASAALFDVDAISPGLWGNDVTVQTQIGSVPSTSDTFGSFTLIVNVGGAEVERWPDLTIDPNGNRYAPTVVNNYSRFVRLADVNDSAVPAAALTYYTAQPLSLTGGTSAPVIDSDYVASLDNIDVINGNLLLNPVGQTGATVISAFITKAANRGDAFVIIDPDKEDVNFSDLQATAANFSGLSNGGYAAQYVPVLKMVDPAKSGPGAIRDTFPGGAIAGLYVRTEVSRTVAKAPAGYSADIRGALGLVIPLTDTQIGTLYDGSPQVNSMKAIPGAGITVAGARTLNKLNPDKFVNVRRTLNYLKYSLKDLSEFAVFENNDPNLWTKLNMTLSSFLSDFWRAGGLKGSRAAEAFIVVCDETNNTQTSIDQGIVNVQVGVALQYPAEFIVINLSQWAGGSQAVESF